MGFTIHLKCTEVGFLAYFALIVLYKIYFINVQEESQCNIFKEKHFGNFELYNYKVMETG